MDQKALYAYAKRNGFRFDIIPRAKTVFVDIPALPLGNQINIYFPFDTDLEDSLITEIRCALSPTMIASDLLNGKTLANAGTYKQFVVNFINKKQEVIYENISLYLFLQTAGINVTQGWKTLLRYQPDRSFLTYFDVGNTKGAVTVPFIFTYHRILKDD